MLLIEGLLPLSQVWAHVCAGNSNQTSVVFFLEIQDLFSIVSTAEGLPGDYFWHEYVFHSTTPYLRSSFHLTTKQIAEVVPRSFRTYPVFVEFTTFRLDGGFLLKIQTFSFLSKLTTPCQSIFDSTLYFSTRDCNSSDKNLRTVDEIRSNGYQFPSTFTPYYRVVDFQHGSDRGTQRMRVGHLSLFWNR